MANREKPGVAALKEQIRRAFEEVEVPPADQILADDFAANDDCCEMAQMLAGKHWTTLLVEDLFYHRESLFALSAVGFRAYVPAYLAAALTSDAQYKSDIHQYLTFALYGLGRRDTAATRQRLSLLNAEQRTAIAALLVHLEIENGADDEDIEAIHRHWTVRICGPEGETRSSYPT
jgi:hypothetical protein